MNAWRTMISVYICLSAGAYVAGVYDRHGFIMAIIALLAVMLAIKFVRFWVLWIAKK